MGRLTRLVAVAAAASIPFLGLSAGPVGAKPKPVPHPRILVTVSPNPLVETASSNVAAVIQVECIPADCANNSISISSTQLTNHCAGPVTYETLFTFPPLFKLPNSPISPTVVPGSITVGSDNDGNTTVVVTATNCAPGTSLITADLNAPPFFTGTTKLTVLPPQVTPVGLRGYPNPEVEVGDGGTHQGPFGESDIYAVFYVEAPPVFAEQPVTITSDQLTERCGLGFRWELSDGTLAPAVAGVSLSNGPGSNGNVVTTTLDNDGNAVFVFKGASCAAGHSTVIADVQNNGPTLSTMYRILPPAVTI